MLITINPPLIPGVWSLDPTSTMARLRLQNKQKLKRGLKKGAARDRTGTARDNTVTTMDKTEATRDKTGTARDKKGTGA